MPIEGKPLVYLEFNPTYGCGSATPALGYDSALTQAGKYWADVCNLSNTTQLSSAEYEMVTRLYMVTSGKIFEGASLYTFNGVSLSSFVPLATDHVNEMWCTGMPGGSFASSTQLELVIQKNAATGARTGLMYLLEPNPNGNATLPVYYPVVPFAVTLSSGTADLSYSAPGFSLGVDETPVDASPAPLSGQLDMTLDGTPYSFAVSCTWDKS
jgi:hypothetical protein